MCIRDSPHAHEFLGPDADLLGAGLIVIMGRGMVGHGSLVSVWGRWGQEAYARGYIAARARWIGGREVRRANQ